MRHWIRALALLGGLFCLSLHAAPLAGQFSDELSAGDYDCQLTLEPAATLGNRPAVRISLETGEKKAATLVTVTRATIELAAIADGKRRVIASLSSGVAPGAKYHLTVLRRGARLGLMRDTLLLGHADVPRAGGTLAAAAADPGWKVSEARIQRIEPVVFSDDFMRNPGEANSPWTTVSGRWRLKSAWDTILHGNERAANIIGKSHDAATSQAQNPFAWVGAGEAGKPALCTTGNPFWEEYTFTAAVNPARGGACGLLCNLTPAGTALLARWTPANDRGPGGNALTLCAYDLNTGKSVELAASPGGYVPGQWYRLTVATALEGVRVLVDGQERLAKKTTNPWRGAIGLYAEGAQGATFDDVSVYGRAMNLDLLVEARQLQITQRFTEDKNGMKEWALNQQDWVTDYAVTNFHWYRQDIFGSHSWMSLACTPPANADGELWMTLNGDGRTPSSGYRAVVKATAAPAKTSYTLYREGKALASKTAAALEPNTDYSFRFWHVGERLWLEVDGETVLEATDATPPPGLRAAYRNDGAAFAAANSVLVEGYNTLDYPFTEAPVDWLAQGSWEPSIRWSCTPDWSFLAGWSRGNAVLWHKQRFAGDQSIEAYVGTKMDYPRETDTYFNRQGYFAVTLCGDGQEPRTGYAGVYGYPDENGAPLGRAVILRNGVVVAQTAVTRRSWAANHRSWFYLQLNKRGGAIDFTARIAGENYQLSYTDPTPIAAGIPALWTCNNAMTVARARLDFAQPPTPRADPQVVIADPWYPEWANAGAPLALDLADSWSTAGKPIAWAVTPAEVPAGDEQAARMDGNLLRFDPKAFGRHWYRVAATDGPARSQDYHLSLPVFTPALRRDDTHALVLYRFDEGQGTVVHDRSPKAPALDLTVTPDPASVAWQPGQGISLRGGAKAFASSAPADKLLALRQAKACTLEVWESADTLFSQFARSNCFFSWEPDQPGVETPLPYLSFVAGQDYLQLAPGGAAYTNLMPGFVTSLHHVVLVWDGAMTTGYLDGVRLGESAIAWNPNAWAAGAKLYVGGQQNSGPQSNARLMTGQLYLLAIHDRAFTPEEIQRHYKAGPSAR